MPAHDEEVLDAQAEGVQMRWLSTVTRAEGGRLMLEKMFLNDKGIAEPTGEHEELAADSLVLALGQDTDLSLLSAMDDVVTDGGVIGVDDNQMTGRAGVFAGGDAGSNGSSERTVTAAVGHGARAAVAINEWLAGCTYDAPAPRPLADLGRLNPWYYADAPRTIRPRLEAARRRSNFDEVVGGLTAEDALFEARRCMSCGNCFECDNCFGVCPDNAVIKLGPGLRYEFNLDYCKGCGICASECPCGAIDMVPEHR
jgi:NADPH-dependent glutamate synthase beta subunit-like oxidoreductase